MALTLLSFRGFANSRKLAAMNFENLKIAASPLAFLKEGHTQKNISLLFKGQTSRGSGGREASTKKSCKTRQSLE